jgi:uncharacterized cupin superfamily protein
METPKPYPHIVRKAAIEADQATFSHPWNPASQITGSQLSRLGGLRRTGISVAKLAPGKESFAYHSHHTEEEWIYILSGTAVALIDGQEHQLAAGDFAAFPTPSVAHNLANRSNEELVYLMGGENHPNEVADFPTLDRRMVKLDNEVTIYRLSDGKPFGPIDT